LKNYQVTRFDSVLIYSISAGAGDVTIILAERCSVTPLKCLCFVVIHELAMPEEIKVLGKKIESEISEDDFISGFKCWKESTSTSPSGCHFGHYKAIVNDPDLKKQSPSDDHLHKLETNFVQALVKLLNITLQYGFEPKGWCNSVTVMIKKDLGNPQIE
jgi:hypothetical protein